MKLKNYSIILVALILISSIGLAPLLNPVSAIDHVYNQTNIYNPTCDYFCLDHEPVGVLSIGGIPSETGTTHPVRRYSIYGSDVKPGDTVSITLPEKGVGLQLSLEDVTEGYSYNGSEIIKINGRLFHTFHFNVITPCSARHQQYILFNYRLTDYDMTTTEKRFINTDGEPWALIMFNYRL